MSHLTKRNGVYYLYYYQNGKYKGKRLSKDRQTAIEYQRNFDINLDRDKLGIPLKNVTWKEFCNQYLAYSIANKSKESIKRDKSTIRKFDKLIPIRLLSEFTNQNLEQFKAELRQENKKAGGINRCLNTLKNMGVKAEDWNLLRNNPVKKVKKLPDMRYKGKVRFLTKQEIKKLLNMTQGQWKTSIIIALYTGFRRGEVVYLSWDDVDFEKNTISVTAKENWTPKDYEMRVLPLHFKLKKYLMKLKRSSKNNKIINTDVGTLTTMMRRIIKKTDFKNVSFHTLRHTFASHLAMSGVDLFTIKELLGHASVTTTQIYAHLLPDYMKNSISNLQY